MALIDDQTRGRPSFSAYRAGPLPGSSLPLHRPSLPLRHHDPVYVGQGSGLGLDIVRRLVQRQAEEIEVESRPGRTEFQVSLTVEDDAETRHTLR